MADVPKGVDYRSQVASSFLIELGTGDKVLFDLGTGSYANLIATGNYQVDKARLLFCRLMQQTNHSYQPEGHAWRLVSN